MPLPTTPPSGTTPEDFEDWSTDVATTASDHEGRLEAIESRPGSGVYEQTTPASTWIINHNLGFVPAGIFVRDSAGTVVEGVPTTNTTVQTIIEFASSFSGTVALS